MEKIDRKLDELLAALERMQLEEYVRYITDRKRLWRTNLLIGMARGLGTVIGVTVLGAVLIALLQRMVTENVPVLGDFLADVVRIVRQRL